MSQFLSGKELAEKIRDVVAGENVKCAVAFWGEGAPERLEVNNDWKIICDLKMGGTSAKALRYMHKNCASLKHFPLLHAKVYLSAKGVVIGSANASNNALGQGKNKPALTEVGVYHVAESDVWKKADEWFDALYKNSQVVNERDILEAERIYTPPHHETPASFGNHSFLDMIQDSSEKFGKRRFKFLIATEYIENVTKTAKKSAERSDAIGSEKEKIIEIRKNWPIGKIFDDWPNDMVNGLDHFFEFFVPKEKSARVVACHQLLAGGCYLDEKVTSFYTDEADSEVLKNLSSSLDLGSGVDWRNISMNEDDWNIVEHIQKSKCSKGYGVFTAEKFAKLIVEARKRQNES